MVVRAWLFILVARAHCHKNAVKETHLLRDKQTVLSLVLDDECLLSLNVVEMQCKIFALLSVACDVFSVFFKIFSSNYNYLTLKPYL